jgi:hypothetical protein
LQILSRGGQPWSRRVGTRWLSGLRLSRLSVVDDDGQRDLTQI